MQHPTKNAQHAVIFNKEASSYFRVRYDAKSLCKVAALLRSNHTKVPIVERAQLLQDVAPMAMPNPDCKQCGIAGWAHMMEYLKMERDYVPLRTALDQLERLRYMLEGTMIEARFVKWMHSLIKPFFDDRGYLVGQDESEDQKMLKRHMIKYACLRSEDRIKAACVKEAVTQFKGWVQSDSQRNPKFSKSPYLRATFYKAVMDGMAVVEDPEILNFFMAKYEEAKKLRFQHLEHFQQLHDAYVHYILVKLTLGKSESSKDEICSMVAKTKIWIENPDLGIKVLKLCWYKLKKSEDLLGKGKDLVGRIASKRQIEDLMKWAEKENVTEDVKEGIKKLVDVTMKQLECADMVASVLNKVLPK